MVKEYLEELKSYHSVYGAGTVDCTVDVEAYRAELVRALRVARAAYLAVTPEKLRQGERAEKQVEEQIAALNRKRDALRAKIPERWRTILRDETEPEWLGDTIAFPEARR